MTRQTLYVAATRGRNSHQLCVHVAPEPAGTGAAHGQAERAQARDVLVAIASRRGAS